MEEGQTIQWPKEIGYKDKQRSTKHYSAWVTKGAYTCNIIVRKVYQKDTKGVTRSRNSKDRQYTGQ